MPRTGVNLSNEQWSPWPDGYVEEIAALRPESLLFFAYSTRIPASASHRDDLRRLVALLPGVEVLLRIGGDFTEQDPIGRAEEAAARWSFVGLRTAALVTHNEWNLASEAFPRSLAAWVDWWERHLTHLAELLPDVPRHLAALAPNQGDYRGYYRALAASQVVRRLVDTVDVHLYAEAHLAALAEISALFPGQGLACTEFNQLSPTRLRATGELDTALYFLAGGTADWQADDLLRQPSVLADFRAAIEGGTMSDPKPAPAFDETKIFAFADWQTAAAHTLLDGQPGDDPRDPAAFVRHLKALGADFTRPEEYGLPFVKVEVSPSPFG